MSDRHGRISDVRIQNLLGNLAHDLGAFHARSTGAAPAEDAPKYLYSWYDYADMAIKSLKAEREYSRGLETLLIAERSRALGLPILTPREASNDE